MSVETAADSALDSARDAVQELVRLLTLATDPETWGSDDFRTDICERHNECLVSAIELRYKLGPRVRF